MALTDLFSGIANAIREKDGTTGAIVANDFPARIQAIPTAQQADGPLDPEQVYRETRPADWMEMPRLLKADEMYLLYHIPDGETLAAGFAVTCTGAYTVELGTVEDGVFTASSSVSLDSGAEYSAEFSAADWGGLTADGFKQVMVRVSGTDVTGWAARQYGGVVDIVCRLPKGTTVTCGNSAAAKSLKDLKYFAWYGPNQVTDGGSRFGNCSNLICVRYFDVSKVTSANSFFFGCKSLIAVPPMDFPAVTSIRYMFNNCVNIGDLSHMRVHNSKFDLFGAFTNCEKMTKAPDLMFAQVSGDYAFVNAKKLEELLNLNITSNFNNMFANRLNSLKRMTLDPSMGEVSSKTIDLGSGPKLDRDAIVELFRSLPVSTETSTLTLTGNPGVAQLTEEDKAIATDKNWTLVL